MKKTMEEGLLGLLWRVDLGWRGEQAFEKEKGAER